MSYRVGAGRRTAGRVLQRWFALASWIIAAPAFAGAGADEVRSVGQPAVAPLEYRGDVRMLPQVTRPQIVHAWNAWEEPEFRRPLPASHNGLLQPNVAFAAMPSPTQNFLGLRLGDAVTGGQAGAGFPPDVNGDVGPDHYIEGVNDSYAIYSKTGTRLAAFTENALWTGAGSGTACATNNQGDPVVLHDAIADRWILSNFAFAVSNGNPIAPFYQCIAVSKTADPVNGGWYLYAIRMDPGGSGVPPVGALNDYGKFGVWNDCLYLATNEFAMPAGTFIGVAFASFSRSDMYAGLPLTYSLGYLSGSANFTLVPANVISSRAAAQPPAGTPAYFVSESTSAFAFSVRKFTPGANCGDGGTLSAAVDVNHASYSGSGGEVVEQPGTTIKLDALLDRVMQKVQYRRLNGTESLWVTHTAQQGTGKLTPQWAQINVTGGNVVATPVQQQIYAPDASLHRWSPSLAVDAMGNMALGYSTSSATQYPSIAYSGRLVSDPLNNLSQTETILFAGAGAQTNNCGGLPCTRWGDYSGMSLDPTDDCTFWYVNQYYAGTGDGSTGNWSTRIGAFKFPSCATQSSQTITFTSSAPGAAKVGGPTYTVSATASSGLPVSFSIAAASASVCSLAGSTVSFLAVGTCTIDANQSGNGSYAAAPQAQQSFSVGKGTQTITYTSTAPSTAKVGGPTYTVAATGGASGNAVTFSIDFTATSVCSISGNVVSFIGAGTCVIDANQAGNANYNAATQQQQGFTVGKANQTINYTSTPPAAPKAHGPTYTVSATATSGLAVTFSVDFTATGVCSVAGNVVSFTGTGTCVIDANQAGNANYNAAAQVQQAMTVSVGPATKLGFTPEPVNVPAGTRLGPVTVAQQDDYGNTISGTGTVTYTVSACSASQTLGTASMSGGTATLAASAQRLYTLTSRQVAATTGTLSGTSQAFNVVANPDLIFADGLEACRL